MDLIELSEVSDARHGILAVELLYFFRTRNSAVGIDFDTEFVRGLHEYSIAALSRGSNIHYNIIIVKKAINTIAEKMANMIDNAKSDNQKLKIYPSVVRMEKVLNDLKSELAELEKEYA